MADSQYDAHSTERFVPETHSSSRRTPFERDRARIIHSSAWRRLAAKTQVLSPTAGIDFARNRLTHSLEVAQIGRELAQAFGLSRDIVDTACLAHDLGHPPFGHNGERALDTWMHGFGGFEGNAHTLRILTRLEPKVFSDNGESFGLNLTRATLDASCKYPWSLTEAIERLSAPRKNSPKFGYFDDDSEVFHWIRSGAPAREKSAEAQVMDLSDDIAYSVHDFEDAVVSGNIDPELLNSRSGHDSLIEQVREWTAGEFSTDVLGQAFERIASVDTWLASWSGTQKEQAQLKNFTSDMIGRFARGAITSTHEYAEAQAHTRVPYIPRYGTPIIVPEHVRAEIAVLKGIVGAFVMASGRRQPTYLRQRQLLTELLDALWETGETNLEVSFAETLRTAPDEARARRVIVDQVASLTDQAAISWHTRLCQVPLV